MAEHRTEAYYRDQISSITRIPSLPVIATELMQVTHDDELSVNQLIPIIERDPPLAMNVLKIANSAYYGMQQRVDSLRHAIVIMGMQELRDLSLGFSVIRSLSGTKDDVGLNWQMLWEHSAAVGHIAQLLLEKLGLQTKSSPYALGLLHDIGKIILYRLEPAKYAQAVQYALGQEVSAEAAEVHFLNIDHMRIGAWVAEKWELPQSIIDSIRYHHTPQLVTDPDSQIATSIIQLADIVANLQSISFGKGWQASIPREEAGWLNLSKVSPNLAELDFERFVMGIEDELNAIKDMVRLMRSH